MEGAGHAEETDRDNGRAPAPDAATAISSGPRGPSSDPWGMALFLQRHAGNRAVARIVDARAVLARQETDNLMKDEALEALLNDVKEAEIAEPETDVEELDTKSEDRYDTIAGANGSEVLKKINPAAPAFTKYPCTQNCPKAATDVQSYLKTGAFPSSTCSPLNEPKGYSIDPGPDSWNKAKDWKVAWEAIKKAAASHGSSVLVEGDRGTDGPKDLTQWHYFVVANVRGKWIVVDGFLGEVSTDVDAYVKRLQTKSYSYTTGTVTAKPVR